MPQLTPEKLQSHWFSACTEYRAFWAGKNDIYYSKSIFLNDPVGYKTIDYKDGVFYADGQETELTETQFNTLGETRCCETDEELNRYKEKYPELEQNKLDGCYYSRFLKIYKIERSA